MKFVISKLAMDRVEWSPIRSVIVTSGKQNWMRAERESNLFSRIVFTDRIGRHEVFRLTNLLQQL